MFNSAIKYLLLIVIFSFLVASKVYSQALFLPWPGTENNWVVPGIILPLHRAPQYPNISANWNFSFNESGTIDLNVQLDDPSPTQYSVLLGDYQGSDPGPDPDFYYPAFTIYNVQPGLKYLNIKKKINGVWSTIAYYTVNIPPWVQPTQEIQPTDTPTPFLQSAQASTLMSYLLFGAFIATITALVTKKS